MISTTVSLVEQEVEQGKCFELQFSLCFYCLCLCIIEMKLFCSESVTGIACVVINIYFLSDCIDTALSGQACLF